jgi:hypothetical protein
LASLSEFLDGDDPILDTAFVEKFAEGIYGTVVIAHCLYYERVLEFNCDLLF